MIEREDSSRMFNADMELGPRNGFFGRMALIGESLRPTVTSARNFTMNELVPAGNVAYNQGSETVGQGLSSLIRSLGLTPRVRREPRPSLERPGGCKTRRRTRRRRKR